MVLHKIRADILLIARIFPRYFGARFLRLVLTFLRSVFTPRPIGARKNTTQLAKYPCVLYVKPSNKICIFNSHKYVITEMLSQRHTWRFYTPIAAIGENLRYLACQILAIKFAKCARSRNFLRLLLRIASKANPSGWAILSHEFSKLPHRRDRRKKSPDVSASIGGENRLRFSLAIKFAAIGV